MKTPQTIDIRLINRFRQGDPNALSTVYDTHYYALYFFAYKIIDNTAEAEDITIMTLEILLRRHKDFETLDNIKAFLYITVRNRCLNYLESVQRKRSSQKELSEVMNEDDDYILLEMVRAELINEVYLEIENLPPKRRSVLCLFLEGLTTEEIGSMLHMKTEAVRFNKSKAVQQLRNTLISKKLLPLIVAMMSVRCENEFSR